MGNKNYILIKGHKNRSYFQPIIITIKYALNI